MRSRIFGAVLFLVCGGLRAADDLAQRVVLLANSDDRDSVRIAEHYAAARGVPRENIVALPMARGETVSWADFIRTIWEPLEQRLVAAGWIDAIPMHLVDAAGRTKYAVSGNRISYLVVCRGVPLRVLHDAALYVPHAPLTDRSIFRTNAGAVDSELSLLARPNYPINAFVSNPLYRDDRPMPLEREQVVKVSRLDGPTPEDAMALVDHAIEAEKTGLLGRAYVDIGGIDRTGDQWFESVVKQLEALGFDTQVDRARSTFPVGVRFDAPVLYFGWYAGKPVGPFTLPDFRFPPGAIALHIHSYSAATVRSKNDNWVGPLVARGVTATVGNVFEPYLQLTHRPDLLLRALARGDTWGDAVYYSLQVLSWQTMAIGDPLYRPFAVEFSQQWERRAELPLRLGGYVTVRKMKELEEAGRDDEALALARQAQRERPSVIVGLALAERLQAAGQVKEAATALGFVTFLENYPADEWTLMHQAAQVLVQCEDAPAALKVYRNLLGTRSLPAELKRSWLADALETAMAAGDRVQADAWRKEFSELPDAANAGK